MPWSEELEQLMAQLEGDLSPQEEMKEEEVNVHMFSFHMCLKFVGHIFKPHKHKLQFVQAPSLSYFVSAGAHLQ